MVKVNWKSFACGIVAGSILFSGISFAAPKVVKLVVDGKEIHSDVPPQIIEGRTMIPARYLAEALGAKVEWDEKNQTVIVFSEKYRQLHPESAEAISEQEVVRLAGEAQKHYWHVAAGGNYEEEVIKTFPVEGRDSEYRWMGSDLNTKEKYIAYLEEVYTPEQAEAFWKRQTESGAIVEIDGKLAQINADGGSLRFWGESKAKLIRDGVGQKTYRLTVPFGEDEYEEKEVKLRFVEGKGWRIDQAVELIR